MGWFGFGSGSHDARCQWSIVRYAASVMCLMYSAGSLLTSCGWILSDVLPEVVPVGGFVPLLYGGSERSELRKEELEPRNSKNAGSLLGS